MEPNYSYLSNETIITHAFKETNYLCTFKWNNIYSCFQSPKYSYTFKQNNYNSYAIWWNKVTHVPSIEQNTCSYSFHCETVISHFTITIYLLQLLNKKQT